VTLYFSPAGLVVVAPLPDGRHRIVATVDEAPPHPDTAFVQDIVASRGPRREPALVHDVVWSSRFRVHHRIADSYRAGRILLAGDAAHVHSPAGGQGMNLGIEDAVSLGETLATVVGGADPGALEVWATDRRPVAAQVIAMADRLTRLATTPAVARPLRNMLLHLAGRVPTVRHRLAMQLSGLDRTAASAPRDPDRAAV
jgi:2-polyprenyl-6-methoxyphenol hydroxylase-like FAD-dependent oxidoreductase